MASMNIPYGTNVEKVEKVCQILDDAEGSLLKVNFYKENSLSKDSFYSALKLATELGFVDERTGLEGHIVQLKTEGGRLLSRNKDKAYRTGLKESEIYSKLIPKIYLKRNEDDVISKSDVVEVIELYRADMSDRTKSAAATLLMKLLEQADYGRYYSGKGRESKFLFKKDVSNDFDLDEGSVEEDLSDYSIDMTQSGVSSQKSNKRSYELQKSSDRLVFSIKTEDLDEKDILDLISKVNEWSEK